MTNIFLAAGARVVEPRQQLARAAVAVVEQAVERLLHVGHRKSTQH